MFNIIFEYSGQHEMFNTKSDIDQIRVQILQKKKNENDVTSNQNKCNGKHGILAIW